MEGVRSIVFRNLTDADFFNINKPSGTETGGGGQSYIDVPVSGVTLPDWLHFFRGIQHQTGNNGPIWTFTINSIGTNSQQSLTIAQRRPASVSIRSQRITSRESNRVHAWDPDKTGFPSSPDPSIRSHIYDLHIYLVSLDNGQYWAGWFQTSKPESNWPIDNNLNRMFTESEGYIKGNGKIKFDSNDPSWPFRIDESESTETSAVPSVPTAIQGDEDVKEKVLFDEDEKIPGNALPEFKEVVRKTRVRNAKAVKKLKQLYSGRCQISGTNLTFQKKDGIWYSEAHHLIPLGEGGSDSVYNIVIISPLLHRMLHYANVSKIDLRNIRNNKLTITINGRNYTITWDSEHSEIVKRAMENSN